MDILQLIESGNYIDEFKKHKVVFRKYPKLNLMIIKQKYGTPYNDKLQWLNNCRGLVVDYVDHKIVFMPPVKACEVKQLDDLKMLDAKVCTELKDGTMVNLFYYNNGWLMSTRSNIGCTNKWSSDINFKIMFDECSPNFDIESLDKENTYSFVMRHTKNRILTPVTENQLILVEMRNGLKIINELPESDTYTPNITLDVDKLPSSVLNMTYIYKGFTLMVNDTRYKWISDDCKFIEQIKPNTNNQFLNYLQLRQSSNLTNYLKYFPENRHLYNTYREKIHNLTKQIQHYYRNVFIYKNIEMSDVPFTLRPFIYELHGIYLKNQRGISWEDVKLFVYQLEPKRICFAINNM